MSLVHSVDNLRYLGTTGFVIDFSQTKLENHVAFSHVHRGLKMNSWTLVTNMPFPSETAELLMTNSHIIYTAMNVWNYADSEKPCTDWWDSSPHFKTKNEIPAPLLEDLLESYMHLDLVKILNASPLSIMV